MGAHFLFRLFMGNDATGLDVVKPFLDFGQIPAFHIDAELPGLSKEQIALNIEDDVLTIKAERKQESEEKKKDFHRVERSYGSFSRSFNLGEMIDQENIGADFENGVLHVTLPKAQPVRKTKEISIR